jgi:hypothetical protein
MSPRRSAQLLSLLCCTSLACKPSGKPPEEVLEEQAPAMKARLKLLKAVCAEVAAQRSAPLKAAEPPEPLIALHTEYSAKTTLNTLIIDADQCPGLALKLNDRSKSLGSSEFNMGYPYPVYQMADVYLRDSKYQRDAYIERRWDVVADTHVLGQLRYVVVWTLDTLELPRLDAQTQTFEPGSLRGRALLFRLEDAALLSVVAFSAKNSPDTAISHGERAIQRGEQVEVKDRIHDTYEEVTQTTTTTVDLGPWESAAARELMSRLSSAAEEDLRRALPYQVSTR